MPGQDLKMLRLLHGVLVVILVLELPRKLSASAGPSFLWPVASKTLSWSRAHSLINRASPHQA